MKVRLISFSILISILVCRIQAQTEWSKATILSDGSINCIVMSGDTILAACANGHVLRSTDNGVHWTSISISPSSVGGVTSLALMGSDVYAASFNAGLFKSADWGETWNIVTTNTRPFISSLVVRDTQIYAVDGYFTRSSDGGKSWTLIRNVPGSVTTVADDGTSLFAGTYYSGLYRSTNGGATWSRVKNGLPDTMITVLKTDGSNLWAGTNTGVFLSTDHGENWTSVTSGLPAGRVNALAVRGSTVYASFQSRDIYQSLDGGKSWSAINSGLTIAEVLSLSVDRTRLYAGTNDGMWSFDDQSKQWSAVNTNQAYPGGLIVYAFKAIDSVLLAASTLGILRSTDDGTTWTFSNLGLPQTSAKAFAVIDSFLFVGTGSGVFRSTDKGKSWNAVNNDLTDLNIQALAAVDSFLIVGTFGIFRSSDKGVSWSTVKTGLPAGGIPALAAVGTTLFAGNDAEPPLRNQSGVYRSSDDGASWLWVNTGITGINYFDVFDLAVSRGVIYASTWDRIFWSADSGMHWTSTAILPDLPQALAASDSIIIAGTYGSGIYLSLDRGANWRIANLGLSEPCVESVELIGQHIFAGTRGAGIWRRSLDKITKVDERQGTIPLQFALDQNYPNPFNPSTTIAFGLPERSHVSLKIFDVMGREVSTLVSEELPAGTYQRQWNASGFSSGVYFYRLTAGSYTETKRLVLVR